MNKNKFNLLFLLLVISTISEAQTYKNSLQENNLKGTVKTIEETEYGTIDEAGKIEKETNSSGSTISTYNRNGNITEQKVVDSKGIMGFKTCFEYENKLKTKENSFNSKNKVTERWVATYNEKGKIKEAYRVFEGKNIEKVINTYDNKGNILEEIWYMNDVISSKKVYIYSEGNKTIEIKSLDSLGKLMTKEISTYNAQGILLEENKFNYKDSLRGKTICIYNVKEQLIEEQSYGSKNTLESRTIYVYDDKGNVMEEIEYDGKNQRTSNIKNTYTFDLQGNWIEKIEYDVEIKFGTIFKRKITYYD